MTHNLDATVASETLDTQAPDATEVALDSMLALLESGPDLEESQTSFKLRRERNGLIEVDGTFGYERQSSYEAGDTVFEPDTFYIDWVNVTPNKGLGTLALTWALQVAQDRDFHICRTDPVNERMVGLIEKLACTGIIKERYYIIEEGPEVKPSIPSESFQSLPDTITGSEAIAYLQAKQTEYAAITAAGGDPSTAFSAVNCVFYI